MESANKSLSKSQKMKVAGAAALSGALLLAGTFAFFTDRVSTDTTAKAGTVDIALTSNWQDVLNFNPGDMADLSYEISSEGNKSVDVRERLVVTSSVAMDTADQAEFEIYAESDVTPDGNGAYVPNPGAKPIATDADRVVGADNKSITYILDEYVLNGTGENAETEDGITITDKASEYVIVFKDSASNAFQGADVTVDLLVEAKQHRNTGVDTWTLIETDSVDFGGASVDAVPEKQ